MNKADIIIAVSEMTELSKHESEKAVAATLEAIAMSLAKGEPVKIAGFGSFETKERASRVGHNPRTGEEVVIPASRVIAFRAGKALKETVTKA